MTVLIAGGGIGGLTLALSLHQIGISAKVFESVSELKPRGIGAGYKWPQFSIHRGTLQQILLDAATERLGPENIFTSHHLCDWTETSSGVRADFIDKATGKSAGSHDGALLIAADGIHSAIR